MRLDSGLAERQLRSQLGVAQAAGVKFVDAGGVADGDLADVAGEQQAQARLVLDEGAADVVGRP